jgi:hypothetical protein
VIDPAAYNFKPTNSAAVNTTAWNNMMAAIPPAGEMISFPPGDYHHNGLVVNGKSNLHLFGQGGVGPTGATQLICNASGVDSLCFVGSMTPLIQNLWLGHNVSNSRSALALESCWGPRVDNISTWVSGTGSWNGLLLNGVSADGYLAWISHCKFVGHLGTAALLQGAGPAQRIGDTTITNCLFAGSSEGVRLGDYVFGLFINNTQVQDCTCGINIAPSMADTTVDVRMIGVIVDDNDAVGIRSIRSNRLTIMDSWIGGTGQAAGVNAWGIEINASTDSYCEVKSCKIGGNMGGGIRHAGQKALISDNFLYLNGLGAGAGGKGIELTATSQFNMLRDNYFDGQTVQVNNLGVNNDISGHSPWEISS